MVCCVLADVRNQIHVHKCMFVRATICKMFIRCYYCAPDHLIMKIEKKKKTFLLSYILFCDSGVEMLWLRHISAFYLKDENGSIDL